MNWPKLGKGLGRGIAAAQVAVHLATVPVTKDGTPELVKQYAKYAKSVKLEGLRSRIRQGTTRSFVPVAALDKRAAKELRKR